MNDDTVCRVKDVTSTIATLIRLGLVRKLDNGTYETTGAHPRVPTEVSPLATPPVKPVDPYSPTGLRKRGYRVMEGKTAAEDRVEVGGGFYRITAARENGLI
ncbi:hypothetical protein [Cupriavidus metallidurans]|uniref:Uncharacterized protein n=1 Tax=Cupriavidus metallidurans (strain ATCC 43123 / DSM 2839 / NBRC 102507 / CH34) TaxID=266264 RepID=Q1LK95_CUPMC|nr:hypothetical protein [Cupriavidus metallidurans]ABF09431.1 hypothetical protein Rmet_2554 [Cupriavidus metallidurans CH34]QGS29707.1 hypothetical protein FOB83_12885 [Cupriavidus metallidurans]